MYSEIGYAGRIFSLCVFSQRKRNRWPVHPESVALQVAKALPAHIERNGFLRPLGKRIAARLTKLSDEMANQSSKYPAIMDTINPKMSGASLNIVGCDTVSSHINKPIPSTLWHYTSHTGFQGIINSKKIWATEFRFLNDRQEFFHAKELALRLIDEEPEYTGEAFPARGMLRKAVNLVFNTGYLNAERLRIMVASFSEEGDLLSQWRGYADDSRGVSIGFDLRGLRPPSDIGTTVTLAPCLYSQIAKSALLKAVFGHYRDRLQNWWDAIVKNARKEHTGNSLNPEFIQQVIAAHQKELNETIAYCHTNLQFDFLRMAPLLKDESFCEEKEWRLVLPWEYIFLPRRDTIEFRPTRDTLVPYIAYALNMPNQEGPVFCKDLILGSGCHSSAAIGVNLFLQKQGISVLARPSQIPYRPK